MRIFLLFFSLLTCQYLVAQKATSAITFHDQSSHGRLGDRLVWYIKIKWLSFQHNIPVILKPFDYSQEFEFHYKEQLYNPRLEKQFTKKTLITNQPFKINPYANTLYEVDYFFKGDLNQAFKNKKFMQEIKTLIKPVKPQEFLDLPKNITTVALHVRKGGGFDQPLLSEQLYKKVGQVYADQRWPNKFPPDQYYIDQLKRISTMLDHKPLYIYLFTDDQKPQALIDRYKKAINANNITFTCRHNDNHHTKNVVNDLFALTQFDCLIRSTSRFGLIAEIIGDHQMSISPTKGHWEGNKLIIDTIKIVTKDANGQSSVIIPND